MFGFRTQFERFGSGGTSDPYVIVQVSNEKRKTKVIKKDLNPEWAEKFELVVNDVHDSLKVLVFLQLCGSALNVTMLRVRQLSGMFDARRRCLFGIMT